VQMKLDYYAENQGQSMSTIGAAKRVIRGFF